MDNAIKPDSRSAIFRAAIARFIDERKAAKLKAADDRDASLAAKYDYSAWLADAARRVGQIQAVTHVLKATHPDAQGSSLYVRPKDLPRHAEIGTHSLGTDYAEDIVGNAAALDVYKFLKLKVDDRRLLDWFLADDADLLAALHDDASTARAWAVAFNGLVRSATSYASHEKAKQIYWCHSGDPTNDLGFHLLEPLFPSALVHAVHAEISDARFGENNVAARHAKRDRQAGDGTYRDYRQLVARKLGGTQPQNVSQLNSERGGINYLLASLPPPWDRNYRKSLLGSESVFPRLERHEGVRSLLDALHSFVKENQNRERNRETEEKRKLIEKALGNALAVFGAEMRSLHPPGWTRDENCDLPEWACLWLDPERVELPLRQGHEEEDSAFDQAFAWKDWPDDVATNFSYWVVDSLRKEGFPVGDVQLKHFAKQAIVEAAWPAPMQRRLQTRQGESHE
jgi:CRISPR-associated protein Csy1